MHEVRVNRAAETSGRSTDYRRNLRIWFLKFYLLGALLLAVLVGSFYIHERDDRIKQIKTLEHRALTAGHTLILDELSPAVVDLEIMGDQIEEVCLVQHSTPDKACISRLNTLLYLLARHKPQYDQLRFLDETGQERIRINHPAGEMPVVIEDSKLQDKSKRYYFRDTLNLDRGEMFISPLDLNIEHGEIEYPLKPMIRLGRVVFDRAGNKAGVVIINYNASYMFERLHAYEEELEGDFSLLNPDGYWLHSTVPDVEWGFMLPGKKSYTLAGIDPSLWQDHVLHQEAGQLHRDDGIYTHQTVYPLLHSFAGNSLEHVSSSGSALASGKSERDVAGEQYYWKLLSFVSNQDIARQLQAMRWQFLLFTFICLLFLGGGCYFLARAYAKRQQYQEALKTANSELEQKVDTRTRELSDQNVKLREEIEARRQAEEFLGLSEERYRTILRTMNDGVYITQPDYTVAYANSALKEMTGDDPTGKKCYLALYGRKEKCPWCIFGDLVEGERLDYELDQEQSGKTYHVSNAIIRLEDDGAGKLTIYRDVTEYKKTQRMLAEQEMRLGVLAQTMREGLVAINMETEITLCNKAFSQMLGRTEEEIVGHRVIEFVHDDYKELYEQEFSRRRTGSVESYEMCWLRQNGDSLLTQVSPALIKDSGGQVTGAVAIVSDITEARAAEEEKRALEMQLLQAQKMEALGTLAGGIAHDFNNLLSVILGFGQLGSEVARAYGDEELNDAFSSIMKAGERAAELVRHILLFSRQDDREVRPLVLQPIIKETVKFLQATIPARIEIQLDMDPDVREVLADPSQIHQVFMNLCTNACHSMGENGGELRIALKNRTRNGEIHGGPEVSGEQCVCLEVADTGHGIARDDLDKIFTPFFTTKEVGKGTGLGLSMVYSIVKDLAGDVQVESELGKGTVFRVFLPVCLDIEQVSAEKVPVLARGAGEKIAWVDDERSVLKFGSQMLTKLGYSVVGFSRPQQLLEEVRTGTDDFTLIISDYNMPKMSGMELFRTLRNEGCRLPFILCTGFSEEVAAGTADEMGLDGLLMKPLTKGELATTVSTIIRRSAN